VPGSNATESILSWPRESHHGGRLYGEGTKAAVKIALFIPTMGGGGMERAMLNLARGLIARGQQVDLVLMKARGEFLPEMPSEVRIVDLGTGRALTSPPALMRYLRQEHPDMLLAVSETANLVALGACLLTRQLATKLVLCAQTSPSRFGHTPDLPKERLYPLLARRFYPRADAVVGVSEGVRQDLIEYIGLPPEQVHTIHNPIVTPELTTLMGEPVVHPWFDHDQPPVILGVGRLVAVKDFPTLIRAFALVRQRRPARLVILGEGEDRPQLEALAVELDIPEVVDLPGFASNPFAYMAKAAGFVLSSRNEGLPGVLIQALACGCPVASTDCRSGPREILRDGDYGPLVPVGDSHALAVAIDQLLDNPIDAERLQARAADFSIERVTERYLTLFDRLVGS
jgi:glycosyltransferase involved in cell wall biosynthesis